MEEDTVQSILKEDDKKTENMMKKNLTLLDQTPDNLMMVKQAYETLKIAFKWFERQKHLNSLDPTASNYWQVNSHFSSWKN